MVDFLFRRGRVDELNEIIDLLRCARSNVPMHYPRTRTVVHEIIARCFAHGISFMHIGSNRAEIVSLIRFNYLKIAREAIISLQDCLHRCSTDPDIHRACIDKALEQAKATYQDIGTSEHELSRLVAECHRRIAQKEVYWQL